jgi:hypothetical protein
MKIIKTIAPILFVILVSCGQDGQDGDAFIKFTWDWYVDTYEDTNSDTPSTLYENTYYETDPGSYSFEYWCSDGMGDVWYYTGNYTIRINVGEKGGFLSAGDDGEDNHYHMELTGDGADLDLLKSGKEKKSFLNANNTINREDYEIISREKCKEVTIQFGNYQVIIEKTRFNVELR